MNEPIWVRMGVRPKHWSEMTDADREHVNVNNLEYQKHDVRVRRAPQGAVKNAKQDPPVMAGSED